MNSSHTNAQGCEADLFGERIQQPSLVAIASFIFIIIINIITFPFTVALNALAMIAVKVKSRLRSHKSNILLALLASTDFMVGVIIQPTFIVVLVMILLEKMTGYCVLQVLRVAMGSLLFSSLLHLALLSVERYLAMKHPFGHITLITEVRVLIASSLMWIVPAILYVLRSIEGTVFFHINHTLIGLTIALIVYCHATVFRETRRHEKQIAAQQVTQDTGQQFTRSKKAFKMTSIILAVLVWCSLPKVWFAVVAYLYGKISSETRHIFYFLGTSSILLNSFFNPIIYCVRMRQFRLAIIEFTCKTVNIAEAEEIEIRLFGAPNAVIRLDARREHGEHANVTNQHEGQYLERANGHNSDNATCSLALTQRENCVHEQPNNDTILPSVKAVGSTGA